MATFEDIMCIIGAAATITGMATVIYGGTILAYKILMEETDDGEQE